jgi:hypothetical protein
VNIVGCLYCGKDIGAFRLLRREEFCSPAHRKQYAARLGRAIHDLAAPEPAPSKQADFLLKFTPNAGNFERSFSSDYQLRDEFDLKCFGKWPLHLGPVLGTAFRAKLFGQPITRSEGFVRSIVSAPPRLALRLPQPPSFSRAEDFETTPAE